jgi:uncharacterized protein YbjT (DUF2867 family)
MILVTGATGTVGSLLITELRKRDMPVVAMVRDPARQWGDGVSPVVADFDDPATLDAAVAGVDAIYLLAPVHPKMDTYACDLIDAVLRSDGRPRIVLHAALGFDAHPQGVRFLTAHAMTFDHLRVSGLDWTVLAPNGFFQNFVGMAKSVKAGWLALPAGHAPVSYIDAADVATVAAHVLTSDGHSGKVYPLTGPEALTHGEIAARLAAAAGREVIYQSVSGEQARAAMLGSGVDEWRADGLVELYGTYAAGRAAEVSYAVSVLSGQPARSFDEFMAAHSNAFR